MYESSEVGKELIMNHTRSSRTFKVLTASCLLSLLIFAGTAAPAQGAESLLDDQQARLALIPGATVERVGSTALLVHFDSDTFFVPDSAALDPSGRSALATAAGVINDGHRTAVVVQGHTDSVGGEEHNRSLSERRARSVASYLIGHGVDPSRVTTAGLGESQPMASNDTPSGRRQNRRVDVLLKVERGRR
jgi:outer membrane protein OmpA-like peptidoglycan-associated protein